jgi:HlyD family secretion protein
MTTVVAFKPQLPGRAPGGGVITVEPEVVEHSHSIARPIIAGCVVIAVFVLGALGWAAYFKIAGGVVSSGFVQVQDNRKIVRHRDGGIVETINVREGDAVKDGDVLLTFSDVQPRAQVDVLNNQYDNFLAQRARFEAEQNGSEDVTFPPELLNRKDEPAIAQMIADQETLFNSRKQLFESQNAVLGQRIGQLKTRAGGLKAQVDSVTRQAELIDEELVGVAYLAEKGLVPKTRHLALKRAAAELLGKKGEYIAEITRVEQAVGETDMQLAQVREQRSSEAAEGLRDMQTRIADVLPRLRAAKETLDLTRVKATASGRVLNLTQFTIGGVVAPGERLMDIVPMNAPLVIEAQVKPEDIDEVSPGFEARVQLKAYSSREVPPITATVRTVSADRTFDDRTGLSYFNVQLTVDPAELAAISAKDPSIRLTPGMPAEVLIASGERTVLDYLLRPITSSMDRALRE